MKYIALALLIGCGGKEPAPAAPPMSNVVAVPDAGPPDAPQSMVEVAIARMATFRDAMCACTNKPCADKVHDEMTAWSKEMANAAGDRMYSKPTEAEMSAMTEIATTYGECMTRAMSAPP